MLVGFLNYSYKHGELSTSQKQALMILLGKENTIQKPVRISTCSYQYLETISSIKPNNPAKQMHMGKTLSASCFLKYAQKNITAPHDHYIKTGTFLEGRKVNYQL